jgi:hypothetical protein
MSDTLAPALPEPTAPCSTTSAYPQNRVGWLHAFCLLLARAEVAREIGRDAALLILIIAIQEDVQQYQTAPIYFDAELQRATGIRSQKQLDRVRQKAVAAGWLIVDRDAAADASVARYWTVIPNRLKVFQDSTAACVIPAKTSLPSPEVVGQKDRNDRSDSVPYNLEKPQPSPPQMLAVSPIPQAAVPVVTKTQEPDCGVAPKPAPVIEVQHVEQVAVQSPEPVRVAAIKVEPQSLTTSVSNAGPSLQTVEPKKLVAALAVSQDHVISILAAYPKRGDFELAKAEIYRALQKIPYAELLPLVNRYAASRKKLGQSVDQTPTAAVWFERESWKQDPAKWDRLDGKR